MAEDSLAKIETFIRRFQNDERADVREWAEQAYYCLEQVQIYLEESSWFVVEARRREDPEYGIDQDKSGVAVDPAHPGLAVQLTIFMHHFLELLYVAEGLSSEQAASLAKRHGYGQGPRGVREGTDGAMLSKLLEHAARNSDSQSERGKKGADVRHKRSLTAAVQKHVEALAKLKDGLGDYLEPSQLWPRLWDRLDAAELSPQDCGDHYVIEGGQYTYEAFRKQIRRLRAG
jgi:hypothetical protein